MPPQPRRAPAPADVFSAMRVLRRSLARAGSAAFAGAGAGPKQVLVLRELRELGSATQVELARATLSDPAAMMRVIDALERRGWVLRASAEGDRRCKRVSLTPDGRQALRTLDVAYERLRSLANGALSGTERRRFCALAAKVATSLDALASPTPETEDA